MNIRRGVFYVLILTGVTWMDLSFGGAGESEEVKAGGWAIAIHGGAGGDPANWDETKTLNRQQGLQRALTIGRDMLAGGRSALDTVETVIRALEDDAAFNAGRGAVVTEDGRAELDASIMDGQSLSCGAVAAVTRVKNPISLARRVMTETKHVLLVGSGADRFAEQQRMQLVDPDYFLSQRDPPSDSSSIAEDEPHFGTVGCVVLDSHGNLAAGTSTGGTSKKLAGRVGDSPIIGAGTYAANDACAVSGTGIGEEFIRHAVASDVAAQMRYAGRSMADAVNEIMTTKLQPNIGGLIAVSHRGEIVMQHNTPGMSCGAADSQGRFETFLARDKGGAPTEAKPVVAASQLSETITDILRQQVAAWNDGDLDAFMQPYWHSDQLTFSSGGTTTRGFEAAFERYKRRYPTTAEMGRLEFGDLEFSPLGPNAAQVLGRWDLVTASGTTAGGRFTLLFRKFDEGWKIVHDHTSALPSAEN